VALSDSVRVLLISGSDEKPAALINLDALS